MERETRRPTSRYKIQMARSLVHAKNSIDTVSITFDLLTLKLVLQLRVHYLGKFIVTGFLFFVLKLAAFMGGTDGLRTECILQWVS